MVTPETVNYIHQQIKEGLPKTVIRSNLVSHGWSETDVDLAFSEAVQEDLRGTAPPGGASKFTNGKVPEQGGAQTSSGGLFLNWFTGISIILVMATGAWYVYIKYITPAVEVSLDPTSTSELKPRGGLNLEAIAKTPVVDKRLDSSPYMTRRFLFEINPPIGWVQQQEPDDSTAVIFYPQGKQDKAYIEVASPAAAEGRDLQVVVKAVTESLAKVKNLKILNTQHIGVSGQSAYIFETTQKNYHNKILVMVKDDLVNLVTVSARDTEWNNYKELLDASLLTYKP